MHIKRSHVIVGSVVMLAAVAAALVFRPSAIDVELVPVQRGAMQLTVDEDGVTRVRHHVEVTAPINGRVAESRVRVGDSIVAGAVLAHMSPAPLDPRTRDQAEAAARAATALRVEAEARVRQAEVAYDEARRAHQRAEQLHRTGVVADRDFEQAADLARLRERDLAAAQAREQAARQEERRARLALTSAEPSDVGNTVALRASMTGRVLRLFEEHDRVVPAGTPLVEIGDPRDLEVVVDVLTRDAMAVRPGAPMLVRIAGQAPARARVERVEPTAFTKVSPLGVEEQRVNVIGRFVDSVPVTGNGFEVDASIVTWHADDVLRVPVAALVPIGSKWGVFRLSDGRAALIPVDIGRRGTREVEVRSGLRQGDTVVVHPDDRLRSGARVRRIS